MWSQSPSSFFGGSSAKYTSLRGENERLALIIAACFRLEPRPHSYAWREAPHVSSHETRFARLCTNSGACVVISTINLQVVAVHRAPRGGFSWIFGIDDFFFYPLPPPSCPSFLGAIWLQDRSRQWSVLPRASSWRSSVLRSSRTFLCIPLSKLVYTWNRLVNKNLESASFNAASDFEYQSIFQRVPSLSTSFSAANDLGYQSLFQRVPSLSKSSWARSHWDSAPLHERLRKDVSKSISMRHVRFSRVSDLSTPSSALHPLCYSFRFRRVAKSHCNVTVRNPRTSWPFPLIRGVAWFLDAPLTTKSGGVAIFGPPSNIARELAR